MVGHDFNDSLGIKGINPFHWSKVGDILPTAFLLVNEAYSSSKGTKKRCIANLFPLSLLCLSCKVSKRSEVERVSLTVSGLHDSKSHNCISAQDLDPKT